MLTVIIPIHNEQKTIKKCLSSIQNQSYKDIEIIVVDDGSTDNSLNVCQEIAKEDGRIIVISQENRGVAAARNEGIKRSCGQYITFVDGDDWIDNDAYEKMVSCFEDERIDVVCAGMYKDYDKFVVNKKEGFETGKYVGERLNFLKQNMISLNDFFQANVSQSLCNKIFKAEIIQLEIWQGAEGMKVGEDGAVLYPTLLNAKGIYILDQCFYHYCDNQNSTMRSGKVICWENYQKMFSYLYYACDKVANGQYNIHKQIKMLELYITLLHYPEKVIHYNDNILFPFGVIEQNDRVILYGNGVFGKNFYRWVKNNTSINIICRVDKNAQKGVEEPEYILKNKYDKIIIAVLFRSAKDEILKSLMKYGIDIEKIVMINIDMIKEASYLLKGYNYEK